MQKKNIPIKEEKKNVETPKKKLSSENNKNLS